MDLSVKNIVTILQRGLKEGFFSKNSLFKRGSYVSTLDTYSDIDNIDDILNKTAIEIKRFIESLHPLSLQKDSKLYKGKEYFWLIFHDRIAAYVLSRLLNDELKEAFCLDMKSRNELIEQLIVNANNLSPKAIIRSDIKSFFESIDHRRLFERLESNPKVSALSMTYYRIIFDEFNRYRPLLDIDHFGLPRGLSISSYLAEVYLKETDSEIMKNAEISYYGRYVDDIVILVNATSRIELNDLFYNIVNIFDKAGLRLHDNSESKTSVFELSSDLVKFGNYLGYELNWNNSKHKMSLGLPKHKILKKKEMIDIAFSHFEKISRKNLKKARQDLMACLHFISGNFYLKGRKRDIRTGLFYANPHLSDLSCLDELTNYLQSKLVIPYERSFTNKSERTDYILRVKNQISRIDFRKNWTSRKMYSFSPIEMSKINAIIRKDINDIRGI